jgi:WD40 repeat protein
VRGRVPRRIVATDDEHEQLIEQLVAARLVTSDDGVVELAHESLARAWPRLRDWLDDDVEGQRILRHLTTAADAWQVMARPDSELYRGARLAQALEWREQAKPDLSPTERAFLDTSAQLADAEQRSIEDRARHQAHINRRLRALLAGVAILLIAAVAAGTLAIIQRGEARDSAAAAREAETAQLAQRLGAQALVEEDLDLSLLLARQAVAIDDTPQTRGYLLAELLRSPAAIGIMHVDGDASTEWNTLRVAALSPDGQTLAIGGPLVGPFFFDARTYEQIGKPPTVTVGVEALAYSPDGATLAVGGFGLRLLDARTHEVLAEVPNVVSRVAFTNDGSRLAVVESVEGGEAWITIRDAATLQPIGSPIRPAGFGGLWLSQWWTDPSIAWSPDGGSLVTASTAGQLAWWDVETGQQTRTFEIDQGYRALAVSPDGLTAAIGLDDGIGLLDVRTGELHEARGTLATNPNWLLFSPDGQTVVSTGRDGTVTLWDVGTATPRETLRGHADAAWQPVFSADGETLYTASADGTAIAWDVGGVRRFGRTFTFTDDHGGYAWPDRHPGRFSPDGQLIAVGLNTEGIQLWDAAVLAPAGAPMLDTGGEVATLAFSPDGDTLAAVTAEGMVTVWDIETRSLRHGADRGASFFMDISADGRMLATPSGNGVKLWDVATGASLGDIGEGLAAGDVAFSPTEPVVAFLGDGYRRPGGGRTEIWDLTAGSLIRALQVDSTDGLGWALAFSVDGRTLATGGGDPLVHLWDVQSGQLIREIEQNVGSAVWSLAFSLDGQTLAMSGGDGFASLWDVATGAQIGPRLGVGSREAMLDLSHDGQHLLLTNGNGEGAVWDVDPESWAQRACTLANRTLTPDEWEEFLPGRRYEPACDKPNEGRQR